MLPIVENFLSIQGEGPLSGNISIFIRFGGCNFSCAGFGVEYTDPITKQKKFGCDSFYSVDQSFKKEWNFMEYSEIVKAVDSIIDKANLKNIKPDIVITGGEPLIYWKNNDFQNLLIYYISRGHRITIETNGSLDIKFDKNYQKEIIFSMSVKLKVSGEPEHKRINVQNLINILENSPKSYFKFVISKQDKDTVIKEIESILNEIPWYSEIYLMPMGETTEVLNENALTTVELAIKQGWKYSDRMHIRLWENKKGV